MRQRGLQISQTAEEPPCQELKASVGKHQENRALLFALYVLDRREST